MAPRHVRTPVQRRSSAAGRLRLLVVLLAPLLVVVPLSARAASHHAAKHTKTTAGHRGTDAQAAAKKAAANQTVVKHAAAAPSTGRLAWSRSWGPGLALLSDYQKGKTSKAGFLALPASFAFAGRQKVTASVTFKTRWVDVKALADGPNIAQQGRYASAAQFKLQIFHGPHKTDHRGQCRIKGTTGSILAFGPAIDVADGRWHTLTCIKSADSAGGTKVVVVVDGVAGRATYSRTPIGTVSPPGKVDLGGRSAVASSDSLDGWIRSLRFSRG